MKTKDNIKIKDTQEQVRVVCFHFKNVHEDFKKVKVSMFGLNQKNEGIQINATGGDLQKESSFAQLNMHNLCWLRIQTAGNQTIKNRNFGTFHFQSTDRNTGLFKSLPWQSSSKISAYQFQSDIAESYFVKENKLNIFDQNCYNDIVFDLYPDTELFISLSFKI